MSADTWRLASASLAKLGLVRTDELVTRVDLESPRIRKRYQFEEGALDRPALIP